MIFFLLFVLSIVLIIIKSVVSGVVIGVPDELNKGLGFEKCILSENENNFDPNELHILMNLRDSVTNFILKLAGI